MNFKDAPIVGLSATLFDGPSQRLDAALRNIAFFCQWLKFPFILADGGSKPEIVARFEDLGATVVPAHNLGGQAMQYLAGVDFFRSQIAGHNFNGVLLKLEAEKEVLTAQSVDALMHATRSADIITFERSPRVRTLMPVALESAERRGGKVLEELGLHYDLMFGVVGYTQNALFLWEEYRKMVNHHSQEHPALKQWLYLYVLPLLAKQIGLPVKSVRVDYSYPQDIVEIENVTEREIFIDKRGKQLETQVRALCALYPSLLTRPATAILQEALVGYKQDIADWLHKK